jgi:hypothetical protein
MIGSWFAGTLNPSSLPNSQLFRSLTFHKISLFDNEIAASALPAVVKNQIKSKSIRGSNIQLDKRGSSL